MGCAGCNDGCFDESVQLQSGPQGVAGPTGATGSAGATGATGATGVSVLVQNISVSSPATIGSGYSAVVFSNANTFGSFTVPAAALVTAGDMLRIEVTFQNDTDLEFGTTASPIIFTGEMLFGGTQVWEGVVGYGDYSMNSNGKVLKLDLIVTATDTLTSKVRDSYGLYGSRVLKWAFSKVSSWLSYSAVQVPATNASGVAIGPITPNLANTNLISFRLKNSSNNPAHLASITSVSVIKYKI
jgi:hypothetical protein